MSPSSLRKRGDFLVTGKRRLLVAGTRSILVARKSLLELVREWQLLLLVVATPLAFLAITALGKDFRDAVHQAYEGVKQLQFTDAYYRSDIGFDL